MLPLPVGGEGWGEGAETIEMPVNKVKPIDEESVFAICSLLR